MMGMSTVIPLPKRRPEDLAAVFNSEIRALMGRHNVHQGDLAKALGTTQSVISSRLTGRSPWRLPEVETLARYFGCSPAELLGGTQKSPGPDGPGEAMRARRDSNPQPSDWEPLALAA